MGLPAATRADGHLLILSFVKNISGGREYSYIYVDTGTAKQCDVLRADDVVEQCVLRHEVQHYNITT